MISIKKIYFLGFLFFLFPYSLYSQKNASPTTPLQVGHRENVNEVKWSPDNTKVLSHSSPDDSLRLWDVKTGQQIWAVNTSFVQKNLETYTLNVFDWSADQKLIASTGYNGKVQLWDAESGKILWNVQAHKDEGTIVKFSPNDEFLVSIAQTEDSENEIILWNIKTGESIRKLSVKSDVIVSATFSADGKYLTTGNSQGEIFIWNTQDGSKMSVTKLNPCGNLQKNPRAVGYSPDLSVLVGRCWEKTVVTDTKSGKVLHILDMRGDWDTRIGFSRDEKILALTDVGYYKIVNLATNQITRMEDVVNSGFTYELNNDGSLMAEGGGYKAEGIQITDVKTGKAINRLESHPGIINSLAFSPDGNRFASGSTDRIVRVWDTETRKILLSLSGHTDEVFLVQFSSDGKTLTSKGNKETITWDAISGEKLSEEKLEFEESEELKEKVSSPNNKYILEDLGDDKPFRLMNARNGKLIREFSGLTQIQGFKFLPNERQFISAAYFQPLQLWDIETGRKLMDFHIGYSHDNVITFNPNGKTFITGGWNQNILMYDLESGKLLWSLFPIDEVEWQANLLAEERRVKYLQDKAEFEKRADAETKDFTRMVFITFEHYGDMTDPGEKKMLESDEPNESKAKKSAKNSNAVWLRLHNNSPLPINIPTQSMYLPNGKCFFEYENGKKILGLCDNREISIWHGLEDKNGKTIPYGFDFGSSAILLPKTSVLFAVPKEILKNGNSITFGYTFQKETNEGKIDDYGTSKTLRFGEKDLPKK